MSNCRIMQNRDHFFSINSKGDLFMSDRLYLQVPRLEEMGYREKLLSQPETMYYNKGYKLNFKNYDNETGCIRFPKFEWKSWYSYWFGHEPDRYYAYIKKIDDNIPIGEVNFHFNEKEGKHFIGIVIEAKYRGRGYSVESLGLLEKHAFEKCKINVLHNDFEIERKSAVAAHKHAGFIEVKVENGVCHLEITKDKYLMNAK